MKIKKLIDSFNYAIEGLVDAVRTQRNMRIHMIAALLVLTASFFYDMSKLEILIVLLTITSVITAELFNTAIEFTIDATTNYYHPLAKIAKNISAAAVLLTAINSLAVGYIIFWEKLEYINFKVIKKIKNSDPYMVFLILFIVCIVTLVIKAIYGEGTPLRGGMPSGHSAIAFSIATTMALLTEATVPIILSYILALIVAQSRVDSEIHSIVEVLVGAFLGTFLTIFLFKIFGA